METSPHAKPGKGNDGVRIPVISFGRDKDGWEGGVSAAFGPEPGWSECGSCGVRFERAIKGGFSASWSAVAVA